MGGSVTVCHHLPLPHGSRSELWGGSFAILRFHLLRDILGLLTGTPQSPVLGWVQKGSDLVLPWCQESLAWVSLWVFPGWDHVCACILLLGDFPLCDTRVFPAPAVTDLSAAKRKFADSLNEFKFRCIGDAETDDEICIGESWCS